MKRIYICAISAIAFGTCSAASAAELSANIGVSSNYIWRGVTQTDDKPAVSGGIDYSHETGIYLGAWFSNVSWVDPGGYEADVYGGFAGTAGAIEYDIGLIQYAYPIGPGKNDFTELQGSIGLGVVKTNVAYTIGKESSIKEHDIYASLGAEFPFEGGLSIGVLIGRYDFDEPSLDDYSHYQMSLAKTSEQSGDLVLSIDKNGLPDSGAGEDDVRVVVSWTRSLAL